MCSGYALEDSGAVLQAADLAPFMDDPHVASLGEMMNYPGVLHADPEVRWTKSP